MKNIDFIQKEIFLDTFDVIAFILDFLEQDVNKIIEKVDIPTFYLLDSYHLISLVLRAKRNIFLEYDAHISEEALNDLEITVKNSNLFLASIGFESSLFMKEQTPNTTHNFEPELILHEKENIYTIQPQVLFFKDSLKMVCEDIFYTHIDISDMNLVFNKKIDSKKCTNCSDCIIACPTSALFHNTAQDTISFQSGNCIGCQICEDVCQTAAITKSNSLNLIEYMFNKTEKLVTFKQSFHEEKDA
ncbi:MAG: 4Fe-4S dicluster domain-containing protein [Candidatus Marinarcus sp.]|uniref:4Fe-4S dicluster domain-containing protein n=1 Tax=Candidatus Marinarcus sp. TaxID=3100987 RepID=UPI003B00BB13